VHSHRHSIPRRIIFTYHTNLLHLKEKHSYLGRFAANIRATSAMHAEGDNIDTMAAFDGRGTRNIRPGSGLQVDFYDDNACLAAIAELPSLQPESHISVQEAKELRANFLKETRGDFKADLCRVVALYATGGLYFDIDMVARSSMWDLLGARADFATVIDGDGTPFQAFMASTARHPLLLTYLTMTREFYSGQRNITGAHIGPSLLRAVLEASPQEHMQHVLLLREMSIGYRGWKANQKLRPTAQLGVQCALDGAISVMDATKLEAIPTDTTLVTCGCTIDTAGHCGGPCLSAAAKGKLSAPLWSRLAGTKYCYTIRDCTASSVFLKYEDAPTSQEAAAKMFLGKITFADQYTIVWDGTRACKMCHGDNGQWYQPCSGRVKVLRQDLKLLSTPHTGELLHMLSLTMAGVIALILLITGRVYCIRRCRRC
jgi:hypothetical protein